MLSFTCNETTTYETEAWFENTILKLISPEDFTRAYLMYNLSRGLPSKSVKKENYPLQLFGNVCGEDFAVYIYCATAGYSGAGPRSSYEILKKAEFPLTFEEISDCKSYDGEIFLTFEK